VRGAPYDPSHTVLVGAVAGLATCVVYPLIIAVPAIFDSPPERLITLLAAAMGPLLGIASWGAREFLTLHRRRLASDLGALSNALAGALLTAMFLVQVAVKMRGDWRTSSEIVGVWLGLDVAWDVYVGLGTFCFALAAWSHPRLGRLVGAAGMLVAVGLLLFNLATFPEPPASAGLVDLGPAIGLWYLVVTILTLRSLPWARQQAAGRGLDASP
jgi:hypothetical protein